MTHLLHTANQWREVRKQLPGMTIGFVPTMGALHKGHMALIQRSQTENDVTVVSIFVNPTQFNDKTDYQRYPRNDERDMELLAAQGVDFVFMPAAEELYTDNYSIRISENEISTIMEGQSRPGHFDGVLTVVMKLLCIFRPHRSYFGEKDYQQYLLIKKMAEAFFLETQIIPCATVRDADGVALSSRNVLLGPEERLKAARFPQILATAPTADDAAAQLQQEGFMVDYVCDVWGRRFGAVRLGGVRLIDNMVMA